jgi:hypothetical protein
MKDFGTNERFETTDELCLRPRTCFVAFSVTTLLILGLGVQLSFAQKQQLVRRSLNQLFAGQKNEFSNFELGAPLSSCPETVFFEATVNHF